MDNNKKICYLVNSGLDATKLKQLEKAVDGKAGIIDFNPENFKTLTIEKEDKVLLFLEKCINTYLDRKEQYGDWEENIETGIKEAKEKYGKDYTTEDYLIQMMTWKVARSLDKPKEDTYIDEIIYKIFYYITKNNG